jgi:hypothetical protein
MGAALYVVLNTKDPGFDTFMNGKALSCNEDNLAALARKLGVTPLMEFFSADASELADFAMEAGMEEQDLPAVSAQASWFDPDEGLRTARALISELQGNPVALQQLDLVIADLKDSLRILEEAKRRGLRWHLAVDF